VFTSSISAVNAASQQFAAAAGNIANATTPGYSSQRVDLASTAGGGVRTAGVTETGEADLASDYVTFIEAGAAFKVNLKALKAQSEMLGYVLDLMA
jgi:flagellar hook protein FlgE